MKFEDIIKNRTATRKFSDKKVEQEKLDKILEAGRLAPTAKNLQPFKIYVINSQDGVSKLDECTPCRYGAKTVLLVCGDKDKAFEKDGHSTYEMDSSIVATHMMLEATNLGIDNIWIEFFDSEKLRKAFDIPDNLVPVCLLPIGYKSDDCPKSPGHGVRKSIEELAEYR